MAYKVEERKILVLCKELSQPSQYPGDVVGLSGLGLGLRLGTLETPRMPARLRMLLGNVLATIKC